MELCWLTCVSSELNGGELTRSGGVDALGRLLQRCLGVLPRDAAPTLPATVILTHCLRTFAGMASFVDARQQLAERWASPTKASHFPAHRQTCAYPEAAQQLPERSCIHFEGCMLHTEPQKALKEMRKAVDSAISRQICSDIVFSPSVHIVFKVSPC